MSLKQGVSLISIFFFCFLFAFVSGKTFFSVDDSSAESTSVDIIASVEDMLAITTITTDAVNGELVLDITPTPGGTLVKNQLTVTVSTNSTNGYTLSMNSQTTNTSMVHQLATGSPPAPNIPSTSHSYNTPAALGTDTWGWNLGAANSVFTFSKIPPSNDSQTIRTTSEPSSVATPILADTLVTFGANVTDNMVAGDYINTIVFTATSNYVSPPEGNFAANDAAAKITAFDEHGVLTSTMGLTPIDYTNNTTYNNTTTSTIGRANYDIVRNYLNNKQQVDVDGAYYLEAPSNTNNVLNNLVDGDSVRMRGVGNVHEIVYKRRSTGTTYPFFALESAVSLYVQNIDFEVGHSTEAPKDSRLFQYRIPDWPTTTFLIDEIIIRDCSFKGAVRALYYIATPPSGYAADRQGPSKHVINKVALHNNTLTNVLDYAGFVRIVDPYVKEFRVTNNTIRNSGWEIVNFLNDNVSNGSIDGSTAHNNPDRPSIFYIDENTYINDDSFDIFLAWKDVRETASSPWGARSTWTSPTDYFSFVVHKGSLDVTFTNNYFEGLNTWGTATQPNVYTSYLSGRKVIYEDNISKNLMAFDANKDIDGTEMFKFKENFGFSGSDRIVRNNKVILEDDFPERILGTGTLASIPPAVLLDMLSLRITQNTNTFEAMTFENNYIDVYSLLPYSYHIRSIQHYTFNHNTINTKYLRSWTDTVFSAFMAINLDSNMPVGVTNYTRTMIGNTINVAYANTIDPAGTRRNIALFVGHSPLTSVVTIEDNIFNMGELSFIFADRVTTGTSHGTANLPNMTLKFNNNVVTTKPPGNINKKDVATAGTAAFNQFNGNTTSPGFNFIGSN